MNPFKGLCMAFLLLFLGVYVEKSINFESEITGHEVSAKAVHFYLTIILDE